MIMIGTEEVRRGEKEIEGNGREKKRSREMSEKIDRKKEGRMKERREEESVEVISRT